MPPAQTRRKMSYDEVKAWFSKAGRKAKEPGEPAEFEIGTENELTPDEYKDHYNFGKWGLSTCLNRVRGARKKRERAGEPSTIIGYPLGARDMLGKQKGKGVEIAFLQENGELITLRSFGGYHGDFGHFSEAEIETRIFPRKKDVFGNEVNEKDLPKEEWTGVEHRLTNISTKPDKRISLTLLREIARDPDSLSEEEDLYQPCVIQADMRFFEEYPIWQEGQKLDGHFQPINMTSEGKEGDHVTGQLNFSFKMNGQTNNIRCRLVPQIKGQVSIKIPDFSEMRTESIETYSDSFSYFPAMAVVVPYKAKWSDDNSTCWWEAGVVAIYPQEQENLPNPEGAEQPPATDPRPTPPKTEANPPEGEKKRGTEMAMRIQEGVWNGMLAYKNGSPTFQQLVDGGFLQKNDPESVVNHYIGQLRTKYEAEQAPESQVEAVNRWQMILDNLNSLGGEAELTVLKDICGVSDEEFDEGIQALKGDGEIYEPSIGKVKSAEG